MTSISERPEQASDYVAEPSSESGRTRRAPPPCGRRGPSSVHQVAASYPCFSDVNERSQFALNRLITPATSADCDVRLVVPDPRHRRRLLLISVSTSPHAWPRSSGSSIRRGLVDRLVDRRHVELRPVGVVLRDDRLAVERHVEHRLRVVEVLQPARRSGRRPAAFSGTLQNFVYMIVVRHLLEVDLEPELLELALEHLRGVRPGRRVVADHGDLAVDPRTCRCRSRPSSCTRPATPGSPFGLARKSRSGPSSPPASSNPGKPGGMKWVATGPTSSPPRVLRRSVAVRRSRSPPCGR